MGRTFNKGDVITIDGGTGQVLSGAVAMLQPELSGEFAAIMEWADAMRRMRVRTNAETPTDARTASSFGAEGIGLCRTEHMFFEGDRIIAMREMILADTEDGRREALALLLPMQRSDFAELFEIMAGLPLTIRLLDPPLHEFLPNTEDEIADVAEAMGVSAEKLRQRTEALHEFNPMLGHRGCRLAVSYPEIAEMQARAIFEAAVEAGNKTGRHVVPEVMVPLVGIMKELDYVKARIDSVARQVMAESGVEIEYLVGTMIELPRAAIRAHVIAEAAEFFSFGTNDLTQTTFGISRDDASSFIETYRRKGIVEQDPFVSLDIEGVGELVRMAADKGRAARPDLKLGICGEHGGDPASIAFCEEVGARLCIVFTVPRAHRQAGRRAGGDQERALTGFHRHPVAVEGCVVLDGRHLVIGLFVGPHHIRPGVATCDAPITGITLEWTVGGTVGTRQLTETNSRKGNVDDRCVFTLAHHHCIVGRCQLDAVDIHLHPFSKRLEQNFSVRVFHKSRRGVGGAFQRQFLSCSAC